MRNTAFNARNQHVHQSHPPLMMLKGTCLLFHQGDPRCAPARKMRLALALLHSCVKGNKITGLLAQEKGTVTILEQHSWKGPRGIIQSSPSQGGPVGESNSQPQAPQPETELCKETEEAAKWGYWRDVAGPKLHGSCVGPAFIRC